MKECSLPQAYDIGTNDSSSLKDQIDWMTTKEVAEYLSVSVGQIRNWTSNGKVSYYKIGRHNRYLRSEVDALLFSNKRGGI